MLMLAALLGGCSGAKVTEILVSIATDLEIPTQLAAFNFDVFTEGSPRRNVPGEVGPVHAEFDLVRDKVALPGTIGLFPLGDPARPIHIVITGFSDRKEETITREARLPFAKDQILLIRMNLLASCLYKKCPSGETCKGPDGRCTSIEETPEPYHPDFRPFLWDGRTVAPDRGLDGRAADGSRADGSPADGPLPDRGSDARPDLPQLADGPPESRPPDLPPPDATSDLPKTGCSGGWCVLPPGTFSMGSPAGEKCRDTTNNDEDQHLVTLTRYFEIMQTEVTEAAWLQHRSFNPSSNQSCGASCPVEQVSWHLAAAFCNELSAKPGLTPCYECIGMDLGVTCEPASKYATNPYACPGYRLPTEAEWEYAARAGTTAALHNGKELSVCLGEDPAATEIAWYDAVSGGTKRPVGGLKANNWGLLDMAGNVAEWTADGYYPSLGKSPLVDPHKAPFVAPTSCGTEKMVVVRGGRFAWSVDATRSANRASKCRGFKDAAHGFRCVRSLTNVVP